MANTSVPTGQSSSVIECGLEMLPYPPYSPDIGPNKKYLFPNLKKKKSPAWKKYTAMIMILWILIRLGVRLKFHISVEVVLVT